MGNRFGNFATKEAAEAGLIADGFTPNERGYLTKLCMTGGSLIEPPYETTAIVEITSYRVDGKYATDGKDYFVYQQHFI